MRSFLKHDSRYRDRKPIYIYIYTSDSLSTGASDRFRFGV